MKAAHSMTPAVAMLSGNPLAIPTVAAVTSTVTAASRLVWLLRTPRRAGRNGATRSPVRMRIAWEAPS